MTRRGVFRRWLRRGASARCAASGLVRMGFIVAACLAALAPARAVQPDEMLRNPALEARAEQVGRELRCLVCRNESIEDSRADLAHDLRVLVRRHIAAGDSNRQVIDYLRSRYGDYVLLDPPFEVGTALLWGGPGLILLLGGMAIVRFYRRRNGDAAPQPLNPAEQRRLAGLLAAPPPFPAPLAGHGEEAARGAKP